MRTYVFNGSPHIDGNEKAAIELFLEGMYTKADVLKGNDVSLFSNIWNLHWMNLQYCKDCGMCTGNGGRCIIQDDFKNIGERLATCDVLVFATPVVEYGMSAQLKNAIDRMMRCVDKQVLKGMKIFLLVTGCSEADKDGFTLIEQQMRFLCERYGMHLLASRFLRVASDGCICSDSEQVDMLKNLHTLLL